MTKIREYFDDNNAEVGDRSVMTEEMGVGDVHSLIDRLLMEGSPDQFLRELVQNSIEAGSTRIFVGPDPQVAGETDGEVLRFMIADNGRGMNDRQLASYMNQISCSGNDAGVSVFGGNYGIGAKISCLGWNPHGMIVMSWVDGVGRAIRLWRDPATGKYGLRRFVTEGDRLSMIIDAPDEYKPDFVDQHGTVIVLCGKHKNETTYRAGGDLAGDYYLRALNQRYFHVPDDVRIQVSLLNRNKVGGWETRTALVHGADKIISDRTRKTHRGVVDGGGFRIYWYLMPEDKTGIKYRQYMTEAGFVANLYQGELYEAKSDAFAGKYFSLFGIYRRRVSRRVVLVVEPEVKTETADGVLADSTRSRLVHTGTPDHQFPWERYADHFRRHMPKPIRDAMEESEEGSMNDLNKVINRDLNDLARAVARPTVREGDTDPGNLNETGEGDAPGGEGSTTNPGRGTSNGGSSGGAGTVRRRRPVSTQGDDNAGRDSRKSRVPTLRWVEEVEEDGIQGFVGRYDKYNNVLFINTDFHLFREFNQAMQEQHGLAVEEALIDTAVRRVWGRNLAARVVGAHLYRGNRFWTEDRWDNAVSPESLTAAIACGWRFSTEVAQLLKHVRVPKRGRVTAKAKS